MSTAIPISLKVWGDLACFTTPEAHVERLSYPVITPSAARGILEAIFWKPQIRYELDRITVLKPIRFTSIRRNEIQGTITVKGAAGVNAWMKDPSGYEPYLVDSAGRDDVQGENRTQRNCATSPTSSKPGSSSKIPRPPTRPRNIARCSPAAPPRANACASPASASANSPPTSPRPTAPKLPPMKIATSASCSTISISLLTVRSALARPNARSSLLPNLSAASSMSPPCVATFTAAPEP
jgi:CRISPR-associated Cas5-like protein